MTDTNNGWPDKGRPGVPLNPERDGWHWVSLDGSDHPKIMEWFSDAMVWADDWTVEACAMHLRYHGPVLTPAEIAAKDARIAELEAKLDRLMGPPPDKEKLRQGMMAAGVTEKTVNEILKSPAFNR